MCPAQGSSSAAAQTLFASNEAAIVSLEGWFPEQKLTVAQAVHAYTVGSAYAESQDDIKGRLAPGKLADFDVLSDDIFHIDPVAIEKVTMETIVVGGEVVSPK